MAFCLAWGFDFNLSDNELKMTPLHLAVNAGSLRIVSRLLKYGANKDKKDK